MEKWECVAGYEGIYDVSDKGEVRRVKAYNSTSSGKKLRWDVGANGYARVHLSHNGKVRAHSVHRLVAACFLDGSGEVVDHIDGNKLNNAVENLRFCTQKENIHHAIKRGTFGKNRAILIETEVMEIKSRLMAGESCANIARDYPVSVHAIRKIKDGKNWL
jgi:hypothetical protein